MYRAAFLDVDGIIRHNDKSKEGGKHYILNIDDVEFIDGALEAHRLLYEANMPVFWVTIQNAIVDCKITLYDVTAIFDYMRDEVSKYGGYVHMVFPLIALPGDLQSKAKAKYDAILSCQDVDFKNSFAIGDSASDILAYKWIGIDNIYQVVYVPYERADGVKHTSSLLDAVRDYLNIKTP